MSAISLILFSILFATFGFSSSAQADYRVFDLHLLNTKTNTVKQIRSTLDPEQYETLYPLQPDEKLTYVQTWRCRGRTDFFKAYCEKPERKSKDEPARAPASQLDK